MRPILFQVGFAGHAYGVPAYGLALALGFMVAIALGARQAERSGEDGEKVRDLCFWLLVSSFVGARLLFVVTELPDYVRLCRDEGRCFAALSPWQGGLVFYGGFFGALACGAWYMRRRGLRFWRIADLLAPSVALGHFFGRLGCFAAGCCWGRPAAGVALGWAVRFPKGSVVYEELAAHGELAAAAAATPPLHPVQLYEAGGELLLFVLLSWYGRRKRWDGEVLALYLVGYGALRLVVELWRGDAARKFLLPGLATSQAIALGAALGGLALLFGRRRRRRG